MKKIVYLVNVSRESNTINVPLGLGHISKSLEINQIPYEIIDPIPTPDGQRVKMFKSYLDSISEPGIFGFTIVAGNRHIYDVEDFARMAKEADERHIVVYGGPLPSAIPEMIIERTLADYVIMGEGEEAFPIFLNVLNNGSSKKKFEDVPNLAYRGEDGIVKVNPKLRVENLDPYHPISFERWDMEFYMEYLRETNRCIDISGSRGCRAACTFCFRFSGPGLTIRSGQSLFEEVSHIVDTYGITKFNFTDENFLEQKESFYSFLELIEKSGRKIKFRGQTRVDEIEEEFCKKLVQSGLFSINFGVESADNDILKSMAKQLTVEELEEKIKMLKSHDVEVFTSAIVGFPGESKESIEELMEFIVRNSLMGHCMVNYLVPLPATTIYRQCVKQGLIPKPGQVDEWEYVGDLGVLYEDRSVNMTDMDYDEIGRLYLEAKTLGDQHDYGVQVSEKFSGIVIGQEELKQNERDRAEYEAIRRENMEDLGRSEGFSDHAKDPYVWKTKEANFVWH